MIALLVVGSLLPRYKCLCCLYTRYPNLVYPNPGKQHYIFPIGKHVPEGTTRKLYCSFGGSVQLHVPKSTWLTGRPFWSEWANSWDGPALVFMKYCKRPSPIEPHVLCPWQHVLIENAWIYVLNCPCTIGIICTLLKVHWHLWTEDWGFVIDCTWKLCRCWRARHRKGLRARRYRGSYCRGSNFLAKKICICVTISTFDYTVKHLLKCPQHNYSTGGLMLECLLKLQLCSFISLLF